jgi:hypothetical protein
MVISRLLVDSRLIVAETLLLRALIEMPGPSRQLRVIPFQTEGNTAVTSG